MRTTLNIDDDLIKEAKIAAIREGITLTAYIERALRNCRGQRREDGSSERWTFPTFPGGPVPGFPWSGSYSKMLEFLEGPEDGSLPQAQGPFPTREGKPLRDFDWADSSALIEELEGPDARS